ncbi:hypothetical protein [Pectinatus frisingensis]|uniref:hypothetical protein n=1 Tax=Pectinatus frisingensis TaxID=865 RepID=UPI0018C605F4|nr:hypothetical protein [Pectinatus frisingensis]
MRYIQPTRKTTGDKLAEISGGYNPGSAVRDVVASIITKEREEQIKNNILRTKKYKENKSVSITHHLRGGACS